MSAPICPYCLKQAELKRGEELFPRAQRVHGLLYWHCAPCQAWIDCEKLTNVPSGRLADKTLRALKVQVNEQLAEACYWMKIKTQVERRALIMRLLRIGQTEAYVNLLDEQQCRTLIDRLKELRHPKLRL